MKKHIIKISFLALITLSFFSCSDFLDQEVKTELNNEQVYNTESGVESALNGVYSKFSDPGYYGSSFHGLVNVHSGRFFTNQTAAQDGAQLNCLTNNTWLDRLWPSMYQTIEQANLLIANVEGSELANRDTALGNAYFLRALTYFDLVRLFGGVPIKTEPADYGNLHFPRSSKEDVYQLVIEDLNKAKNLLPENAADYRLDRPSKWAAYAYMAKVYMQLASEEGAGSSYWQMAWNEASQVYNKYSLVANYGNLFNEDASGEFSNEAIFELNYSHLGGIRNSDRARMYMPSNYLLDYNTFGWIRPNKEIFQQHNTQYPNDPRIASTFIYGSYMRWNKNVNPPVLVNQNCYPTTSNGANGFTVLRKWFDPSYNGTTIQRNHILFRYADLLLMLAEIENEINGPANAYQYVNEVLLRARNSVTPAAAQPADWSSMSQDEFRDRIMKERQYELLGEGQDWFDARRRGFQYFLDNTVVPHNNFVATLPAAAIDFTYPETSTPMLLPIFIGEILNNNNMSQNDQNPGY